MVIKIILVEKNIKDRGVTCLDLIDLIWIQLDAWVDLGKLF